MQMTTTVPTATIPPITPPAIAPALLPPVSLSPVLDSVGDVVTTTLVTAAGDSVAVIVIDSDDVDAVDDDSDVVIAVDVDENVVVMSPPKHVQRQCINTYIHTYIWLVYTYIHLFFGESPYSSLYIYIFMLGYEFAD